MIIEVPETTAILQRKKEKRKKNATKIYPVFHFFTYMLEHEVSLRVM